VIEAAGAAAIATTSAGIAWALGYPDGQKLAADQMLRAIGSIVPAVHVPVTADVESGYVAAGADCVFVPGVVGPALTVAADDLVSRAAHDLLEKGSYTGLDSGLGFGAVNGLLGG
jgi:2-methylisocitrate lyase-like PEP mutase family enzyme